MKRICFVTSGQKTLPAIQGGAVEQLVQLLCDENEINPQFEITVVCCYNKEAIQLQNNYTYTRFINLQADGKIMRQCIWKIRGLLRKFGLNHTSSLHTYERQCVRYVCNHINNFNIVIAEACEHGVFRSIAKRYDNQKLCLHLHYVLSDASKLDGYYGSMISLSIYSLDKFSRKSSLSPKRCFLLHNGIDVKKFSSSHSLESNEALKKSLGFNNDDFIVVFCGRIIPEKGALELIEALLKIKDPHVKLLIIGSSDFATGNNGEYASRVKSLSDLHYDRIRYTGFIPNNEVPQYYQISNIGIIPSKWEEGFCLVLLEMMAAGLPTIATTRGGLPEVGYAKTTIYLKDDENLVDNIVCQVERLRQDEPLLKEMSVLAKSRSLMFDKDIYFNNFSKVVKTIIECDNKDQNK